MITSIYVVILLALVLFVCSGGFFLFGSSTEQESIVFRRFKRVTGYQQEEEEEVDLDEEMLEGTFYERAIYPILDRVAEVIGGDDESDSDQLELELVRAGRPGGLGPNEFIALQLVLGLLSVSVVVVLALIVGPTSRRGIGLTLAFAAISGVGSYIVPKFYLSTLVSNRQHEVKTSLPYAIDLLVVSSEAGLGFDMALNRVTEKMDGALAEEFKRVAEEVKLGTPRQKALKNLEERMQVEELSSFVSAIIQAEELGASVGEVLRIQADQIRTARRQQIEEMVDQEAFRSQGEIRVMPDTHLGQGCVI
ncbi:MAG: type II secretion system F family protein, partial [bacterium]